MAKVASRCDETASGAASVMTVGMMSTSTFCVDNLATRVGIAGAATPYSVAVVTGVRHGSQPPITHLF